MNRSIIISCLFCFLILGKVTSVSSQTPPGGNEINKLVDFLPPPPNAASIAKASRIDVNKNSGAPNFNIPLYNLKGRELAVDLSLSYATNGIKVDEIASRTGMGWSLNAGGVVSRIIRGAPDENIGRKYPWAAIGNNWSTYNYMNQLASSTNSVGIDGEPDLFSFSCNGISGSFVFDELMNPVQLPAGNYKIEKDFSANAPWNFKITIDNGIRYYFGGTGATEKTKRESTCGKNYDNYLPTAWYLTKIEHPAGETILFSYTSLEYTYDTGISETMELVKLHSGVSGCTYQQQFTNTSCTNYVRTQGVLLNTITTNLAIATFTYGTRSDCSDKLLTNINVNNRVLGTNLVKSLALEYTTFNTSPYLHRLIENAVDLSANQILHRFEYNDPQSRPLRLNKSQDHWGYFNGKVNQTLLPANTAIQQSIYANLFSGANANREPDFLYASKGLLNKIFYPTGGIDSIVYEPNTMGKATPGNSSTVFNCSVSGTGTMTVVTKDHSFTLATPQRVEVGMNVVCNTGGCLDNIHLLGSVAIVGTSFYQSEVYGTNDTYYFDLPAGSYILRSTAAGSSITNNVSLTYKNPVSFIDVPKVVAGIRVKYLLSGNPNEMPLVKRYYYGNLLDLNNSSLFPIADPIYLKDYLTSTDNMQCNIQHIVLYSNSLRSLFDYGSHLASYSTVVESIGENLEGGGTQTEFLVGVDALGIPVVNNDILNAPLTNVSITYNGKVKEEIIFKRDNAKQLQKLKSTRYIYKNDVSAYKEVPGYVVFRRNNTLPGYDTTSTYGPPMEYFDMMKYMVYAPWVYLDSIHEYTYMDNQISQMYSLTKNIYSNKYHKQLTSSLKTDSKGTLITTLNYYPHDYYASGNVYDKMIIQNNISPIIYTTSQKGTKITGTKVDYFDFGNNLIKPKTIQKLIDGQMETDLTIDSYDVNGNILQYKGNDGITNSFIWGYQFNYPVAKIAGATYNAATNLMSMSIASLQNITDAPLRAEINSIRIGLPQSQVVTYTYNPNIGVSSIIDPNNQGQYFEYDYFLRHKITRDSESSIVKQFKYNYSNQVTGQYLKLYFNDAVSKSYISTNCPLGTKANPYAYNVPARKYFSVISKDLANSMALKEAEVLGQQSANAFANCTNNICTGEGYKMIGCACELGTIVGISCTDNADGTWVQYYRYKYSDNSMSANTYSRLMQACSGAGMVRIGCDCFVAFKLYVNSVPNSDGSWTCTYKYRYPTGSGIPDSPTYTEISSVNCGPF